MAKLIDRLRRTAGLLAVCVLLGQTIRAQTTWYVAVNGTGTGSSWPDATNNIQGAINTAADNDTVLVSNGTYYLTSDISITKPIAVRGLNPPSGVTLTRDPAYAIRLASLKHAGAVLDGFTMTNGWISGSGGGVSMTAGILTNCIILNNSCTNYGGGVYVDVKVSDPAIITDCRIISNQTTGISWGGGGIFISGDAYLLNSSIADNTSYLQGGGLRVASASDGSVISNCIISGNGHAVYQRGAGLYIGARARIIDCVVSNNSRNALIGGISIEGADAYITSTTITHNRGSVIGGLGVRANGSAFISNCLVCCNEAIAGAGGGIRLGYTTGIPGTMTVTHSRIIGNLAYLEGGGVHFQSNGVLENCLVASNSSQRNGAGVYIAGNTAARIRNCLIAGNAVTSTVTTYSGGGIYFVAGGTNSVESCTIVGNQAVGGSGGGLALAATGDDVILNAIISSNNAGNGGDDLYFAEPGSINSFYNSCSPVLTNDSQSNITNYPVFVDPGTGYGVNLAMGNYRLTSGSPCINSGANQPWMVGAGDYDGRPRLDRFGRLVDIGCYEYLCAGSLMLMR